MWIVDNRTGPTDFPELTEMTFASFIYEFRRHFGDIPFALKLQITHTEAACVADYSHILRVPVEFSAERNAVQIDPNWLEVKMSPANAYLFGILAERGTALLQKIG